MLANLDIFNIKYVNEENEQTLLHYQYQGTDYSLLYRHILSPFSHYFVDNFIPRWVAPNVITLVGSSFTMMTHLLVLYYYSGTLEGVVPAWLCFLCAFSHFVYMHLDNCDGKQARRTKSSSPLGLLFDHGCDAINTFMSGLTLFTVIQLGNSFWSMISFVAVAATFFIASWEEYHLNILDLPWINGATEGQFGIVLVYFFSGLVGTNYWNNELGIFDLQNKHIIVIGYLIMGIVLVFLNFRNVYNSGFHKFMQAIRDLVVFSYMIISSLLPFLLGNDYLVTNHCRVYIYAIGFNFVKLAGLIQVSHCAGQTFNQNKKTILISLTIINIATLMGHLLHYNFILEDCLLIASCLYAFAAYCHFVICIINQFTKVLQIEALKIKEIETKKIKKRRDIFMTMGGGMCGISYKIPAVKRFEQKKD